MAQTFDHQIKHLLGLNFKAEQLIKDELVEIPRLEQRAEALKYSIEQRRKFIEENNAAIKLLEGAFDPK